MQQTETKSYTPGAVRAAREIDKRYAYLNGIEAVAETISRETGDLKLREQNAEILEALKRLILEARAGVASLMNAGQEYTAHCLMDEIDRTETILAKVEGQ